MLRMSGTISPWREEGQLYVFAYLLEKELGIYRVLLLIFATERVKIRSHDK
jgi:hypothetical protein